MVELILSDGLLSHIEVFVETLSLGNEVSRNRIRSKNLSRVDVLVEVADSLLQSSVLNGLFILHGGPRGPSSWSNRVEGFLLTSYRLFHFLNY